MIEFYTLGIAACLIFALVLGELVSVVEPTSKKDKAIFIWSTTGGLFILLILFTEILPK